MTQPQSTCKGHLPLIKKGDRINPTVYQFGSNHLMIHRDGNADICDPKTGACIRSLRWEGLRELDYSPALLLDGNQNCQHVTPCTPKISFVERLKSFIGVALLYILLGTALITVSHITGCSQYMAQQLDADIATSTVYPRVNHQQQVSDNYIKEFRKQNAHANRVLAKARLQAEMKKRVCYESEHQS